MEFINKAIMERKTTAQMRNALFSRERLDEAERIANTLFDKDGPNETKRRWLRGRINVYASDREKLAVEKYKKEVK